MHMYTHPQCTLTYVHLGVHICTNIQMHTHTHNIYIIYMHTYTYTNIHTYSIHMSSKLVIG